MFKRGHKGRYKSKRFNRVYKYRSRWELRAYKILDADPNVVRYDVESLRIKYVFLNKIRTYIPDILVEYKSGDKFLIEVKPSNALTLDRNVLKFKAAMLFCKTHNMKFKVWTEAVLWG